MTRKLVLLATALLLFLASSPALSLAATPTPVPGSGAPLPTLTPAAPPPSPQLESRVIPSPTPTARPASSPALAPIPAPCVPNALITLTARDAAELRRIVKTLEERGGCAVHVFPPNALIGFLPPDLLRGGMDGIAGIYQTAVAEDAFVSLGGEARQAVHVWNNNFINPAPPPTRAPGEPTPRPLVGDVVTFPGRLPPPAGPNAPAPGPGQTSEFMAYKIAVGIILPESNGAIDQQTENWGPARLDEVIAEIQAGMGWWSGINPNGLLSFYYDIHRQVPTGYEPINRPSGDLGLCIGDTLNALGYYGTDLSDQLNNYANSIRNAYGTDWVVVTYVVDSLNDPDGAYTDGYFGFYAGIFIAMTYDNDGWGIRNMDSVMAHEFGHAFGAGDEYCQPGYACCSCNVQRGYLGIPNSACCAGCDFNGNGVCDGNDSAPGSNCLGCSTCVQTTCLMRSGGVTSGLDQPSREQVGMRDSDADGIPDPIDTTPGLSLTSGPPDILNVNAPTWTGLAKDIPYPAPFRTPVTINHITTVEYMVDYDGIWHPAAALDGSFDETTEDLTLTTALLPDGGHNINIRARNRSGNYSTLLYDTFTVDTVAPTGSVVIDYNRASTNSTTVTLSIAATDATSGLFQMRLSNDSSSWYPWETYASSRSWELASGDGTKTVYIQFKDNAGNASGSFSDSIILDTVVPTAVFIRPLQNACINTNPVAVEVAASDDKSGVDQVQFAAYYDNGSSWNWWDIWMDGDSSNGWLWMWNAAALSDQVVILGVAVWDGATNLGNVTIGNVRLDRTPPSSAVNSLPSSSPPIFTVGWGGMDALCGISRYDVQYRDGSGGSWTNWQMGVSTTFAGFAGSAGHTYYFRSRARDASGNVEGWPANADTQTTVNPVIRLFLPYISK